MLMKRDPEQYDEAEPEIQADCVYKINPELWLECKPENGRGNGHGRGYGYGDGSGHGNGRGNGYGYGYGYGAGLDAFNFLI